MGLGSFFHLKKKNQKEQDAAELVNETKKAEEAEDAKGAEDDSQAEEIEHMAESTKDEESDKPESDESSIEKNDANLAFSEQFKASMGKNAKHVAEVEKQPAPRPKTDSEMAAKKKIKLDKIQLAAKGNDSDLDRLSGDSDWQVREAVAKRGRDKDLDVLRDDKEIWVRKAVAEHGRDADLNKLINDPSPFVRMVIAQRGRDRDLSILAHDKSATIRKIVAHKCKAEDLHQFLNDPDEVVREIAEARLNLEDQKDLGNAQNAEDAKKKAESSASPSPDQAPVQAPAAPVQSSAKAAPAPAKAMGDDAKRGKEQADAAKAKPVEPSRKADAQAKSDKKPEAPSQKARTIMQQAKPLSPSANKSSKPSSTVSDGKEKSMAHPTPAKDIGKQAVASSSGQADSISAEESANHKPAEPSRKPAGIWDAHKPANVGNSHTHANAGDAEKKNVVNGSHPTAGTAIIPSAEVKKPEAKSGKIVSGSGLTVSTAQGKKPENAPKAPEKPKPVASLTAAKKPAVARSKSRARVQPKAVAQPIIVSFRCDDKKIADDFAFTGKPGTLLKKDNLPEIPGYSIKNGFVPNKRISVERQTVTINYEPNSVTYRIIPVTEDLEPISTGKHYKGRADSAIEQFPQVKGYRQAEARKYYVPNEPGKDIKVVYVPMRQTIRVVYRAENGEVLFEEHVSGNTGNKYEIKLNARHFDGYEIGHVPNNMTGKFGPDSPDVVIEYVPTDSKIIVDFVDESGNSIHKTLEETGKFKSEYSLQLPIIDGYELASNPDLLTGRFGSTPRHIVLSFRPAPASFMIHYWIGKDKSVRAAGDKEVAGTVGDRYMASSPALQGLIPDKEVVEGVFSAYGNEDVDVVYTPIHCTAVVSFRAPDGSLIRNFVPKKFEGDWGQDFELKLPDIAGYEKPEDSYSSTFVSPTQAESIYYKPLPGSVKVRYVNARTHGDIDGYPAKIVTGLVGTAYNIDPEIIDGYRLDKVPDNASGVYVADTMTEVTFSYSPSLSELVLHYYDSTLNSLAPNSSMKGYYGEPYKIDPKSDLKGYELVSTSYPLEGTFPPNRQDVDLYFKASQITFELVPTNQFGDDIGEKYNIRVTGLMNQTFSERLPEIPGYLAKYSSIEDTIREEYANKRIRINYLPKDSSVTVHSYYKGGNHSGEHVFDDETFAGKVGQNFEYPARIVEGYTPSAKMLSTKFNPEAQDLTIIYTVNTEDYMIHYKDPNDVLVGGMPQATGYYGQAVDVSGSVPRGFHMLSGADSKVYLDGSGVYNVAVNPDELLVDIVPQTADGVSLMAPRQVSGEYHVPQEIRVPEIAGFDPVKGSTLTISFELGQTSIPVVYAPQARSITVRYISVEGNEVHEPTVVRGHYQERYRINPLKIDGYFVLKDEPKVGIYGLSDSNVTFVYRAGSDEYSRAVTPLSEIIKQQTSQPTPSDPENSADYSEADTAQQAPFPASESEQSADSTDSSNSFLVDNQKIDSSSASAMNNEKVESDSTSSDNNGSGQTNDLLAFLDQL